MPTVEELQSDQDFMAATPADQQRYLMHSDPDFKNAQSEDQAAYLAHVTKAPTEAKPQGMLSTAWDYWTGGTKVPEMQAAKPKEEVPAKEPEGLPEWDVGDPEGLAAQAALREKMTQKGAEVGGKMGIQAARGVMAVPGEGAAEIGPSPTIKEFTEQHPKMAGVGQSVGGTIGGMVSDPAMWPLLVVPGNEAMPAILNYLIRAGFSAQMAKSALEAAPGLGANWDKMNTQEKAKAVTDLATAAGMAGMAGAGAVEETPKMIKEGVTPAIRVAGRTGETTLEHARGLGMVGGALGGLAHGPEGVAWGALAGERVGRVAQRGAEELGLPEKLGRMAQYGRTPEEARVEGLKGELAKAENDAAIAKSAHDKYEAGRQQGLPAPKPILDAYEETQSHLQLIKAHYDAAVKAAEAVKAPIATGPMELSPEQKAAQAERVPKMATPEPPPIEVPKTEVAPEVSRMGEPTARMGRPEVPVVEPEAPKPEVAPIMTAGKPERAPSMAGLKVTPEGKVEDTTAVQTAAKEALGAEKPARMVPATEGVAVPPMKGEYPPERTEITGQKLGIAPPYEGGDVGAKVRGEAPPIPRGERRERARTPEEEQTTRLFKQARTELGEGASSDDVMGRVDKLKAAEAKGVPAREPGLLGTEKELKAEGRSPEDVTLAENTVNELRNQSLQNLGARFGLSTDVKDYDFSKREALREGGSKHPVDRDKFHKDLMAKLPKDLVDQVVDSAKAWDKANPHTFDPASRSSQWRAERAEAVMKDALTKYQDALAAKGQAGGAPGALKATMKTARMSNEDLLKEGFSQEQIDKGDHLPTVSGGSPSPEFKKWFGDSKVVDKEGKPLRVYHGTRASTDFGVDFSTEGPPVDEEGNTSTSGSGADPTAYLGAHFAIEPEIANKFAEGKSGWLRSRFESGEEKPRVIPTYLKLENPKYFGSEGNLRDFIYEGKLEGYAGEAALEQAMGADKVEPETPEADEWLAKYDADPEFRKEQNQWVFENATPQGDEDTSLQEAASDMAQQAKSRLEKEGHDGAKYKNEVEGGTAYVAFHPEQILSSISGKEGVPLEATEKETVGTKEGAEKDTEHFKQAQKELPNGTLSEQLKRAQELKEEAKVPSKEGPEKPKEEPKSEKHTYEYTESGDIRQVHARDSEGKSVALVSATAEENDPRLWTVRYSGVAKVGQGIGEKAYMRLAEAARAESNRSGKPITLQGDDELSGAAKRTWNKLEVDRGFDVHWHEGRPSITFQPEKE